MVTTYRHLQRKCSLSPILTGSLKVCADAYDCLTSNSCATMEDAVVDFSLPSPKRQRVEEPDPSGFTDDLDDIYDTSPIKENAAAQTLTPQVVSSTGPPIASTKQAPLLPGLGILQNPAESPCEMDARNAQNELPQHEPATEAFEADDCRTVENRNVSNELPEVQMNGEERNFRGSPPLEIYDAEWKAARVPDEGKKEEQNGQHSVYPTQQGTISRSEFPTNGEHMIRESANVDPVHSPKPSDGAAMSEQICEVIAQANKTNAEAEFEMDSSPLDSSFTDSSDESSSSNDSAVDEYEMLDPEDQARRLMAEVGGSDEEGAGKGNKTEGPLRTANEKPDEIVPKPDIVITADMRIQELGHVETIVENVVLIKAKTSGEYQVLEFGSVLCLEDKTVVGAVAETLGRVQQPYYAVRFTNSTAIAEAGISKDTTIFYVEQHSTYVFTQPLKAFKGSDASNIHDEEVGDDELEFSDDEAEAEHKRRVKQQKQARRGGRQGVIDGFSRGPRGRGRGGSRQRGAQHRYSNGLQPMQEHSFTTQTALNYDDGDGISVDGHGEELYTPLARPANLHEMIVKREAPTETQLNGFNPLGGNIGRGRGRGHRGSDRTRGRGRGQSNSGRGASDLGSLGIYQAHNQVNGYGPPAQRNGFPAPPHPPPQQSPTFPHSYPQHSSYPGWGSHDQISPNHQQYAQQYYGPLQFPPSQPQFNHWQSPPQQQQGNQNFSQASGYYPPQQDTGSPMVPPDIPAGAYVNPAFFRPQAQNTSLQSWPQQNQQASYGQSHR